MRCDSSRVPRIAHLPTQQSLCDTRNARGSAQQIDAVPDRVGEENSFIGRRKKRRGGSHEMHLLSHSRPSTTTDQVSTDLHEVGVKDFYLHVICRDHAGLKRHQIHSSNYFETLDIVRDGVIEPRSDF